MYNGKFRQFYNQQFKEDLDFNDSLKLLNNYTKSIAPKEKYTYNIFFSTDWQTDLICRRYVQIEEVMQKYWVCNREDLNRRLANSDKLGETLEQTEGLPLEVVIELVKDLNYIWVIDPKEENDSFGQPVKIPTRDITVDFEHKELVVYNECDNEEWYRFPFEMYKKTWWLKNDTPITAVEDSNKKE